MRAAGVLAGLLVACSVILSAVTPALSADPPTLTVTADDASRLYSHPNPSFTATVSGFVNGDDLADLDGTLSCTTEAEQFSLDGAYPITCGGLSSDSYAIAYLPGTLTVSLPQVLYAASDAVRLFGAPDPAFSAVWVLTGDVSLDDEVDLDRDHVPPPPPGSGGGGGNPGIGFIPVCTTPATSTSPPGDYPIFCTTDQSSPVPGTTGTAPGTLTILPAPLEADVQDMQATYGSALAAPDIDYSGFVLGEDAAVLGVICGLPAGAGVGTYSIACTASSLNYDITWTTGNLTIEPAPLEVHAPNAIRTYGTPNPSFNATLVGLVGGDGLDDLGGSLACTSTADIDSPVGSYPITCDGLLAVNYHVDYRPGTLLVVQAGTAGPIPSSDPDAIRSDEADETTGTLPDTAMP